jgi:biotin carboxyl carrier protein
MILEAKAGAQTFRLEVRAHHGEYTVEIDGRKLSVGVREEGPFLSLSLDGQNHETGISRRGTAYDVVLAGDLIEVELHDVTRVAPAGAERAPTGAARVTSPMPGKVARVLVTQGQTVVAGAGLVVVEAMKMENEIRAPRSGTVIELPAREGLAVESGALLAVVG